MIGSYTEGDEPVPGFRLTQLLGWGQAGELWHAVGPGGIETALQIVTLTPPQLGGRPGLGPQLKPVRHPNIVPVLASWLKDPLGNLVDEELVEGLFLLHAAGIDLIVALGMGEKNLTDRLQECQETGLVGIPPDELLAYLGDVARAVDYLNQPIHDLGPAFGARRHGNIRPENIVVVGGSAQVYDPAIAALLTEMGAASIGAVAYVAPEALRSGPEATSDQYALAITYCKLRTGELPFEARSPGATYLAQVQGQLDLGRLPDAEREVIARATAFTPEERYPSCAALVQALRQACDVSDLPPCVWTRPTRFLTYRAYALPQEDAEPEAAWAETPSLSPAAVCEEEPIHEELMPSAATVTVAWSGADVALKPRRSWRRHLVPLILLSAIAAGSLGGRLTRASTTKATGATPSAVAQSTPATVARETASIQPEPVPSESAAFTDQAAAALVEQLFITLVRKADVLDHLRNAGSLSDTLRAKALERAEHHVLDPARLNRLSWAVVRHAGDAGSEYQRALLRAEEACRLEPDNVTYQRTLGLAWYRTRQYTEAAAVLSRCDQLTQTAEHEPHVADLVFLAMAQYQLGQKHKARATLQRLERLGKPLEDSDAQAFLDEVRELFQE
jgi:serine/threonine protein kinase